MYLTKIGFCQSSSLLSSFLKGNTAMVKGLRTWVLKIFRATQKDNTNAEMSETSDLGCAPFRIWLREVNVTHLVPFERQIDSSACIIQILHPNDIQNRCFHQCSWLREEKPLSHVTAPRRPPHVSTIFLPEFTKMVTIWLHGKYSLFSSSKENCWRVSRVSNSSIRVRTH